MNVSIKNRSSAGRYLANALLAFRQRKDVIVLALPRGGVPIGWEIAQALHVPLDVLMVRKLGCPGQPEFAFGAIASGGKQFLIQNIVQQLNIDRATIEATTAREQQELQRREQRYRGGKPPPVLKGKVVIVVDDGLATGATMRVAIEAIREQQPAAMVIAVPVAPAQAVLEFRELVDDVVCLATPEPFGSVGRHYQSFEQVTDEEVCRLLAG